MTLAAFTPAAPVRKSWFERLGIGHVLLGAFLLLYPLIASDFFLTTIGGYSMILGMIALSLMLLAGYGGMVSLAQITIAGVAAYVIAIFGENNSNVHGFGWPWWIAAPFGIFLAALFSAMFGWIAVRTEGIYTIMITLAIATASFYFAQQNYTLFNGFPGYSGLRAPEAFGLYWREPRPFYYLCLACAALAYAAVLYGSRSTFGLTLQAIRDNPRRMRAIGYDVTAHKVFAWFLSGLIAGTAGVLLAWFNGRISPGTIAVGPAINILIIAIIGGLRHPIGPFLGAVVVVLMQTFAIDIVGAERFNTLIGLFFLVIVFVSPDGILGLWERFKPSQDRDGWHSRPDGTGV
ncbi:ABC transporter ATP-binding protein [Hoeflea sp. BAL378]|uniref:branched-chain amino acid ABC transporter permease n=1 Tax=Hoeflea sp. BAL378 TaxID=1547437 RepID=UPI00051355D0|nr:branched-chain amino acid ABC transporter permease [Hoeflea sp. BAL378]KGF67769.1 ABC transporter ATP-binding protein [Hoeflea sp. BAL378]